MCWVTWPPIAVFLSGSALSRIVAISLERAMAISYSRPNREKAHLEGPAAGRPGHAPFHFGNGGPPHPVPSRSGSGPDTIFRLRSQFDPPVSVPRGRGR